MPYGLGVEATCTPDTEPGVFITSTPPAGCICADDVAIPMLPVHWD